MTAARTVTSFSGLSGRPYVVAPEQALLFLASNVHTCHDGDGRLRAILDLPLRWDRLLELSNAHGVTGLVRHCLRRSGYWLCVPEPARLALDAWHRAMRIKHIVLARQLAQILTAAMAAGLDPIVLKGAALAATAYPDPALRPMVDIDLLVDPADIPAMTQVLEQLGYCRHVSEASADAFDSVIGYHHLFFDPLGARIPVEVHWRPASVLEERDTCGAGELRARTMQARIAVLPGNARWEARILAPEAQVVYLATHAAQERHVFSELKLLADIAAVAATPCPPDWAVVASLARKLRARSATYVALGLARDLLGVEIPPAILAELCPPRPIGWAVERTLNPATLLEPIDENRQALVKYMVVDSVAATARLLRQKMTPNRVWLRERDPRGRTGRVAAAYARHVATVSAGAMRKVGFWLLNRRGARGIRRVAIFTRDAQGRIASISFRAEQR